MNLFILPAIIIDIVSVRYISRMLVKNNANSVNSKSNTDINSGWLFIILDIPSLDNFWTLDKNNVVSVLFAAPLVASHSFHCFWLQSGINEQMKIPIWTFPFANWTRYQHLESTKMKTWKKQLKTFYKCKCFSLL